jgi:hypothetical protein
MTTAETEYSKREKFEDSFGGTNNEVYTPEEAILPLLPFLKKDMKIWDCAFGSGRLAEHLNKFGFDVIGLKNKNFLDNDSHEAFDCDIIITNPPYSFKDQFLKRAFEIGKPFAFLLPTKALGEQRRNKLFRKYGIQLIVPDKRINFEIPSGKKSAWFHTSWFCGNMNLPNDLNFRELNGLETNRIQKQ